MKNEKENILLVSSGVDMSKHLNSQDTVVIFIYNRTAMKETSYCAYETRHYVVCIPQNNSLDQ